MKNKALTISILIFTFAFAISCSTGSNQSENTNKDSVSVKTEKTAVTDYSGVYKTSGEGICQIAITIIQNEQGIVYQIKGDKLDCVGKIIIEESDGNTYFSFDGKIAENAPKTISGQFINGTIMIQNYGNAMNEYHFFKQCDEKYLEFKK